MTTNENLQVVTTCYAKVAREFARYCNPENRGRFFDWNNFPELMELDSEDWMDDMGMLEHYPIASQYAKEFAISLVTQAGFVEEPQ